MIETKITLTIKHTRPLPDLCDLVAGRAYTLSHVEDVTAEVVPTKAVSVWQYFYRTHGCPADSANEKECICWHDEGTGNFPTAKHNMNSKFPSEWRKKPSPNEWVLE